MYKVVPFITFTDDHYQKWLQYYEQHVKKLFNYLIYQLKTNDILFREYDFEAFCRVVYNKSSKRIPLY